MLIKWIILLVVWAIVEASQFRRKPFRERMFGGASTGVIVVALISYGVSKNSTSSDFFISLVIYGLGATIIFWLRVLVASLWAKVTSK